MPALPDVLSLLLAAVGFVLLLQSAGAALFLAAFGQLIPATVPDVRRLGRLLALAAIVSVVGRQVLEGARMAGDWGGAMDPSMQRIALQSSAGAAMALRLPGLVLVAAGLRRRGGQQAGGRPHVRTAVSVVGAALAVASFTLTGHTAVGGHRLVLAGLLMVHLLVVAFWIGALWPLYLCTRRESAADAGTAIEAFSRVAIWLVPGILLAGIGLAVALLPGLAALSQPYGRLLLLKLGGFAVLLGLAGLNKWRYGPGVRRGDPGAASRFRRTVAVEYALICAVLAVTATLTMFYSPEPA